MNRTNMLKLAGSLILTGVLSGCFSFGSDDETVQQTKTPTTGQELQISRPPMTGKLSASENTTSRETRY